jgi:hypothetical protein
MYGRCMCVYVYVRGSGRGRNSIGRSAYVRMYTRERSGGLANYHAAINAAAALARSTNVARPAPPSTMPSVKPRSEVPVVGDCGCD